MVTFHGAARIYNERGRAQLLRRRVVIEGEIVGTTPAAINTRIAQIQNGFAIEGGFFILRYSDQTATSIVLDSATSISGVKIVDGPNFPAEDGKAHFCTGQPFNVTLEADYTLSDGDPLVSYSESITQIGTGGPRRVTLECDSGIPQEQIVSANTPVTIIQSGEAVGYAAYPNFNPPIFPAYVDLPDGLQVARAAPRLNGQQFVDYPVRWSYRMTIPILPSIPDPLRR